MEFNKAPDIQKRLLHLLKHLDMPHIDPKRVVAFRSSGSKARARARIWSMPRIWQSALDIKAHYVIEVISHHFDHLKEDDQTKVLIHELMHIPKSFSGALVPHRGAGRRHQVHHKKVEIMFKEFELKTGKKKRGLLW
jgi:predicted metallopeptidase